VKEICLVSCVILLGILALLGLLSAIIVIAVWLRRPP